MISNLNPISLDDVRYFAPAAFSTGPSARASNKYAHVTTVTVLDALLQDGWQIVGAKQAKSRTATAVAHNVHQVSLVHPELPTHREGTPQMHIGNASNVAAAMRLMGGFLRHACLNQLYAGVKVVGGVFHHRGDGLEERVVAGARELRQNFGKVIAAYDRWAEIELTPEQQNVFAQSALPLRWPTDEVTAASDELLYTRRIADAPQTLWHTFNRTQESLIRGGFVAQFTERDELGNIISDRARTVRKVTGLAASERINTGLWDLARTFELGVAA